MSNVVGLHHRSADRLARREFPHLAEAVDVASRYTPEQIQQFATKGFKDPQDLKPDELEALLAYTRVRFADEDDQ